MVRTSHPQPGYVFASQVPPTSSLFSMSSKLRMPNLRMICIARPRPLGPAPIISTSVSNDMARARTFKMKIGRSVVSKADNAFGRSRMQTSQYLSHRQHLAIYCPAYSTPSATSGTLLPCVRLLTPFTKRVLVLDIVVRGTLFVHWF
jgi:hypothetical protein